MSAAPLLFAITREWDPRDVSHVQVMSRVDEELLQSATARLTALPLGGDVEVVLSADFDSSVKRRLPPTLPHASRAEYTFNRPLGAAAAGKAISFAGSSPSRQGGYVIIAHAALFDADPIARSWRETLGVDPERVLVHEGWHTVLQQRGEDPLQQIGRLEAGLGPEHPYAALLRLATVILEEFRVERALYEAEFERAARARNDDYALCRDALDILLTHAPIGGSDGSVFESVAGVCHTAGTRIAACCAERVVSRRPAGPRLTNTSFWAVGGGRHFNTFLEILQPVASASVPVAGDELDAVVETLAEEIRRWLVHLNLWAEDSAVDASARRR